MENIIESLALKGVLGLSCMADSGCLTVCIDLIGRQEAVQSLTREPIRNIAENLSTICQMNGTYWGVETAACKPSYTWLCCTQICPSGFVDPH